MRPIINFTIQLEHDSEHAVRQAENFVRSKRSLEQLKYDSERAIRPTIRLAQPTCSEKQERNVSWLSTITTALNAYLSRIFRSKHDGRVQHERL